MIRLLTLLSATLGLAVGAPPAPTVTGARTTIDTTPTFTFKSKGARSFECAVDAAALKKCPARFTTAPLAVGAHKLRVRAIDKQKRKSRVTTVAISIKEPPPPPPPPVGPLSVKKTVAIGGWPGNPVIAFGSLWVPNSQTGSLLRINPTTGDVVAKIQAGDSRTPAANNPYDVVTASPNAIWYASDGGAFVARIDPATNSVVTALAVFSRPAGIAFGAGSIWVSLLDGSDVLRIDPVENEIVARIDTGPTRGLTFANGSVWAVSGSGPAVFRIDPATNKVAPPISVRSDAHVIGGYYEVWFAAGGSSGVWVANQLQNVVTHLDTNGNVAAQIPLGIGFNPYSIAVDGNVAWVANNSNLVRIDAATNKAVSSTPLPGATNAGIYGVAAFGSQLWVTNYDKGEAYLIGQ
jgi:streptogramin lyase